MNNLNALAPANGTNAIVNAAFAIELDNPSPDPRLLASFAALAPQMTEEGYDLPLPQQMFTVSFGAVTGGTQEFGGWAFTKKNTAGRPLREFALRGNAIAVVVHEYTRWQAIWPEVQRLFNRCSSLMAGTTKSVKSVALQYIDQFTWRVPNEPFPVKDVLRSGAECFAPGALDESGPWHNSFGYRRDLPGTGWAGYRLDNVNLSVNTEGGFASLTIFTIYRYFARLEAKEPADFVSNVLPELFAQAHDDNKKLLRDILTERVCSLINLNG